MMILQMTPFLLLDGTAKEAIRFYEEALGANVVFLQTLGESPDNTPESPVPAHLAERVAHSVLKMGEAELMIADMFPNQVYQSGNQVSICVTTTDVEASTRYYEALLAGGEVNIPLNKVHFSPAYGMVTDRFGVTFQIFTRRTQA